jgi:hypothetical protein
MQLVADKVYGLALCACHAEEYLRPGSSFGVADSSIFNLIENYGRNIRPNLGWPSDKVFQPQSVDILEVKSAQSSAGRRLVPDHLDVFHC